MYAEFNFRYTLKIMIHMLQPELGRQVAQSSVSLVKINKESLTLTGFPAGRVSYQRRKL